MEQPIEEHLPVITRVTNKQQPIEEHLPVTLAVSLVFTLIVNLVSGLACFLAGGLAVALACGLAGFPAVFLAAVMSDTFDRELKKKYMQSEAHRRTTPSFS